MAQLTHTDGRKVRARREELGYTVKQVADAVGCHEDHLRNIELGHRQPSPALHNAIAAALGGIDRSELLAAPARVSSRRAG